MPADDGAELDFSRIAKATSDFEPASDSAKVYWWQWLARMVAWQQAPRLPARRWRLARIVIP